MVLLQTGSQRERAISGQTWKKVRGWKSAGKLQKEKVFWTKRSGWCFALQNNKWIYVRARACVYFAQWDQMKYSSVSVAIDQSSAAPMMDTTALIAPPMPSVSLTHTLLHSHSFIYLSPFFSLPRSQSPHSLPQLSQHCGTQTETNHRFNEIKLGGRPAGGGVRFTSPDSCRSGAPQPPDWIYGPRWLLQKKVSDPLVCSHTENCIQARSLQKLPFGEDKSLRRWFPKWRPGTRRGP